MTMESILRYFILFVKNNPLPGWLVISRQHNIRSVGDGC